VTAASDIHIEPDEHQTLIRCRIDGVLREVLSAPPATIGPLAARIKALSGMRIDERRAPPDVARARRCTRCRRVSVPSG
jgi:type II secretory ATPase GspE/PulE/Tfp pilus assembly ATPase PilB-like protein